MEDYEKETAIKILFLYASFVEHIAYFYISIKALHVANCHTGAQVLIMKFSYTTSKTREHWAPVWLDLTLNSILVDWTNSKVCSPPFST